MVDHGVLSLVRSRRGDAGLGPRPLPRLTHTLSQGRVSVYRHADGIEGSGALGRGGALLLPPPSGGASADAMTDGGDADADAGRGCPAREGGPSVPHMAVDGTAFLNLEVLENSYDGGRAGTLLGCLDTCATPFGKRTEPKTPRRIG